MVVLVSNVVVVMISSFYHSFNNKNSDVLFLWSGAPLVINYPCYIYSTKRISMLFKGFNCKYVALNYVICKVI
jgi:hypothetical protein